MKQLFYACALLICWSTAAVAQAPPAAAAQPGAAGAAQIAAAWTAFAAGRLSEAAGKAEQAAGGAPELAHEAFGLLIRIEAARDRVPPALSAYERWQRRSGRDDRFLLYPIGYRILETLIDSRDPVLRAAATARLVRAGVAVPPGGADDISVVAARAQAGDAGAQQQLAQLATGDGAVVRVGTVTALAAGGAASVPQLGALLTHRSPDVRAAAAEALGTLGGAQAAAALSGARQDPDPYVRLRVSVALAQTGDQEALAVAQAALASPVADIRLAAAEAFRDNPTEASRAAVRSALTDTNPLTRGRAAALLGPSDEGARVLGELLNSDNPTVREETASLVEERLADDLTLLRTLLQSPDPWLRLHGAGALVAGPTR